MFHFNIFNHVKTNRNQKNAITYMKNRNISRKTMLLSLLTLFMFLIMFIPVETNVNVTDIITISTNSTKTPPTDNDASSSPYNERVIVILGYFGLSLIVVFPVLMCMLCLYKMKGSAPCNFKEAFCSCC